MIFEAAGSRRVAEFDCMAARAQPDNRPVELGDKAAKGDIWAWGVSEAAELSLAGTIEVPFAACAE